MLPVNKAKSSRSTDSIIKPNCIVEYQQHGKSNIAITQSEQSGKWALINEQGSDVYLPPNRLTLLPGTTHQLPEDKTAIVNYLKTLSSEALELQKDINLEETWELFCKEVNEVSINDVVELLFGDLSQAPYLAVLRALLDDTIYFKRQKSNFSYEPRKAETVEKLKKQVEVERQKAEQQLLLVNSIIERLKDKKSKTPLPKEISLIEQLAIFGSKASNSKEAKQILEEVLTKAKFSPPGRIEDKAFALLVKINHFSPHQNLSAMRYSRYPSFSDTLEEEASLLTENLSKAIQDPSRVDLRDLLIVSIDDLETRDIDDAISIESTENGFKVGIHITDVSSIIPSSSKLFDEALFRATSIYCPDETIHMLPSKLSEETLSLLAEEERPAISFLIDYNKEFEIVNRSIVRSIIKVKFRLNYNQVDSFLYNDQDYETLPSQVEEDLLNLYELTSWLETNRMENGGMQFNRRELTPKVEEDGQIKLLQTSDNTPARKLVSELMVTANETAALFAQDNGFPMIFRAQEPPETEPSTLGLDIPEGPAREYQQRSVLKRSSTDIVPNPHFGLAVKAYVHCTSPIRRVCDLINQQQLSGYISQDQPKYSNEELTKLLNQTEANLSEASEIQRDRNRYWLFTYLKQQKIKEIDAIVIRTEGPRPLAEIDKIYSMLPFYPAGYSHGKSVSCKKHPGDKIKLNIEKNDPKTLTLKLVEIA